MTHNYINNYFLILFILIPISLIVGPTISLINIILIDLSFLILIIYQKDFSFVKSEIFKYLLIFYLYLMLNSLMSFDKEIGMYRNLGFVRIIILLIAINYFFKDKKFFNKVLNFWILFILIVLLDVFFEAFTGKNVLGYGESYGRRVVSFFKDEPIVGGYLNAFYLILIGFLHENKSKKYKNLILLFSIVLFAAIFFTGERSNSIKALFGIMLFYTFFRDYKLKYKLILTISSIVIILSIILNSNFLKQRYVGQIKPLLTDNQIYFKIYKSAYQMFKENIFFGVGNKNYRVISCSKENIINNNPKDMKYRCGTHPHQIYFELLSEHGVVGTILILYIFYKIIFFHLIFRFRELNYIQLGSGVYILLTFLPLIPSGSMFSDYLITILGINIGIFYASNRNFNIFLSSNKKIE